MFEVLLILHLFSLSKWILESHGVGWFWDEIITQSALGFRIYRQLQEKVYPSGKYEGENYEDQFYGEIH